MQENDRIYYVEVVTSHVDEVCSTLDVSFSEAVVALENSRVTRSSEWGMLGIQLLVHDTEEPTIRPYYLVANIKEAINNVKHTGARVMVPSMEIPKRGKCAIVMLGTVQSGFWKII